MPEHLRCSYLVNPLAVNEDRPRLSWEPVDAARGAVQSAYRIQAATSEALLSEDNADLWDSGKVASVDSAHVPYGGTLLQPGQRAFWRVRTWNGQGQASPWSTAACWGRGLPERRDWAGAKWVSEATPPPPDQRPHNGFHSGFAATADEEKWVTADLGEPRTVDRVILYPARPFDWKEDPGFLFPVRYRVELADDPAFQSPRVVVDLTSEDVPKPAAEARPHIFAAQEARYVRLWVTKLRAREENNFAFALAEMAVCLGNEVLSTRSRVSASDATESGAWSLDRLVDGEIMAHPGGASIPQPAALLARDFEAGSEPVRATLYAAALGAYEVHINGKRVGDQVLAPEWTDYNKRIQYQAHDVTGLVRLGANRLGALLGDGWCVGRIGMSQMLAETLRRVYRDKPALLLRLHIEYEDGASLDVVSDESWHATLDGPVRYSDTLDGEIQDARMTRDGWSSPGFQDAWPPVALADPPKAPCVAQPNEPLRVIQEVRTAALTEPEPGVYVFDLGQNIAGWVRLRVRGEAGTHLFLRHAERLQDDGNVYVANLRGAPQVDQYILRGGPEEEYFEPHFTYHGFRYVEVTGLPYRPARDDLVGRVVCSAARQVGEFHCSEPLLNKLWQNVLWTQRANMFGVPTDCPQRDERLGWQGDIQAFAQTAIFNMDMAAFLDKCIADQRDAQTPDGRFADFAPNFATKPAAFTGAPAWADAGVIVPWTHYVNYGGLRVIADHFDSARRWVDFVHGENPNLIWRNSRGNDYNDWLNSDTFQNLDLPEVRGAIPNEVFATAFFARSAELLGRMADLLEKSDEARHYAGLAAEIRRAFQKEFMTGDGRVEGDTQAGYALALNFGLVPETLRAKVTGHLRESLARFDGRLSTGIQTTHRLMLELAANGLSGQAYALALQRDIPSWGFMIEQGASTIWERWDGYVPGRGFQDPGMNSFNHWAFGAVAEWMYSSVLGLTPDPDAPGYAHFFVRPKPGGGLTHARGSYHSIRGKIAIAWSWEEESFQLSLHVPVNTRATVVLPGISASTATESGVALADAPGIARVQDTEQGVSLLASAGQYVFQGRP